MTTTRKQQIESLCELLVEYAANGIGGMTIIEFLGFDPDVVNDITDDIDNILSAFEEEWKDAPCNPEGATKTQDLFMDRLLSRTAKELLSIKK